jgi:DNA replication protein DnaC
VPIPPGVQIESLDWQGRKLLLLYGQPGVGKSRTAAELCRLAMDSGMTAKWWRCADLVGEVIRGQVNACRLGAKFVVLDDIMRGVSKGVASDILDQAILGHYEAWGAKLVLTSNKGPEAVFSQFSAATGDRIAGGLIAHMGGESLRSAQ